MARDMLALATRAEENIRSMRGQVSGRVALGCTPSSGERLLPPVLAAFRQQFPAIQISVVLASLEALIEGLASQQLQVLLCEELQRRRGWETLQLGSERLMLLAPRGHALLLQEQVAPAMLKGQPLVMPRAGTPLRRLIEDGLRRRGVGVADVVVALETDGMGLTVQAVRAGMGLAFVPQMRLPRGRDTGVVDLAGVHLQQEWYVLRSRERGAPRAVQELFSFIAGKDAHRLLVKEGLKPPSDV